MITQAYIIGALGKAAFQQDGKWYMLHADEPTLARPWHSYDHNLLSLSDPEILEVQAPKSVEQLSQLLQIETTKQEALTLALQLMDTSIERPDLKERIAVMLAEYVKEETVAQFLENRLLSTPVPASFQPGLASNLCRAMQQQRMASIYDLLDEHADDMEAIRVAWIKISKASFESSEQANANRTFLVEEGYFAALAHTFIACDAKAWDHVASNALQALKKAGLASDAQLFRAIKIELGRFNAEFALTFPTAGSITVETESIFEFFTAELEDNQTVVQNPEDKDNFIKVAERLLELTLHTIPQSQSTAIRIPDLIAYNSNLRAEQVRILFEQKYEHFCLLAIKHLNESDVYAEDIVADVFMDALTKWSTERYNEIKNLETYIAQCVIYRSKNLRYRNRRLTNIDDLPLDMLLTSNPITNFDFDIDALIKILPLKQREVFSLYCKGYPHEEIAKMLNLNSGALKSLIYHAKKGLRKLLFPTLETPRLVLREIMPEDAPAIFKMHSDPRVAEYIGKPPMQDISEAQRLVQAYQEAYQNDRAVNWAICLRERPEWQVGTLSFWKMDNLNRRTKIDYTLSADYLLQGIMEEAMAIASEFYVKNRSFHRVGANANRFTDAFGENRSRKGRSRA